MSDPIGTTGVPDANADPPGVVAVLDTLERCIVDVSLAFDRWDEPHAKGPGLYFVVTRGGATDFVDRLGANRWPVEDCASVFEDDEALFEAASAVAFECDGAIVVHDDGIIKPEMVRVHPPSEGDRDGPDDIHFADWMGTRHMSALETSARDGVYGVLTLSEENGRTTVFTDGTFDDRVRNELPECDDD